LLADATFTRWSKIQSLPLVRTSGTQNGATLDTFVFNFRDTWRVSLGGNYKLGGPWTLKAGVAYDQSPVPDAATRSVRLPDEDRTWLSAGAVYQVSKNDKLDFGYSYIRVKDADINNNQAATGKGVVTGTYNADIQLIGVQYQHTF
ncbi:MAG: porin, partial [Betaproteobacteria bacterium]|nr:porin [Betaproteobacteria bacterium]